MRSMISSSVICATRPRALSSSYKVIEKSSCFWGRGKRKRPLPNVKFGRGREKSRYHLCLPLPHGNGLTSALLRDGGHSCVCNARTRHSLLENSFSLQLREVFRLLFCTPLAPTGASLGRTASGYLFPSSLFTRVSLSHEKRVVNAHSGSVPAFRGRWHGKAPSRGRRR